jgi:uncharacterized protein (DUF58 family)
VSLRGNAVLLILATAMIAIASDWNGDLGLSGWWRLPAALLLLGLAYESLVRTRASLKAELLAPGQLYLGRPAELELRFSHALARPITLELSVAMPDYIDGDSQPLCLDIAAGAPATLTRRVQACRLGHFQWPDVKARLAGPLGLAWWPKNLPCSASITVVPDLFRSVAEIKNLAASGWKAARRSGSGAEVLRLREYRPGDPPRVVDWKAAARSGRLVSRDFAEDRGMQIVVAIDAGRSSGVSAGGLERFAHYVNIAARLAQFAMERDDLVGLVIYADRPLAELAPARGAAAVARLRALLAAARIESTESNPLYAVTRVRTLVQHRSLVVLLTDFDDATVESQLAQAVRFLLPKHLPFLAGLSSAAAEHMAQARATDWLDPYRALAAQEYCIGLQRKVRALNALGAPALLARPEQLEAAVFAAYERFSRRRSA